MALLGKVRRYSMVKRREKLEKRLQKKDLYYIRNVYILKCQYILTTVSSRPKYQEKVQIIWTN